MPQTRVFFELCMYTVSVTGINSNTAFCYHLPFVCPEVSVPVDWLDSLEQQLLTITRTEQPNRLSDLVFNSSVSWHMRMQYRGRVLRYHLDRHLGQVADPNYGKYRGTAELTRTMKFCYGLLNEQANCQLEGITNDESFKQHILQTLAEAVEHCSMGEHNRLNALLTSFANPQSMAPLLQRVRQGIVSRAASGYSRDTHRQNEILIAAYRLGYGVTPPNELDRYAQHHSNYRISNVVHDAFDTHFRPGLILSALHEELRSVLMHHHNYRNRLCNEGYAAVEYEGCLQTLSQMLNCKPLDYSYLVLDSDSHVVDMCWPKLAPQFLNACLNFFNLSNTYTAALRQLFVVNDNAADDESAGLFSAPPLNDAQLLALLTLFKQNLAANEALAYLELISRYVGTIPPGIALRLLSPRLARLSLASDSSLITRLLSYINTTPGLALACSQSGRADNVRFVTDLMTKPLNYYLNKQTKLPILLACLPLLSKMRRDAYLDNRLIEAMLSSRHALSHALFSQLVTTLRLLEFDQIKPVFDMNSDAFGNYLSLDSNKQQVLDKALIATLIRISSAERLALGAAIKQFYLYWLAKPALLQPMLRLLDKHLTNPQERLWLSEQSDLWQPLIDLAYKCQLPLPTDIVSLLRGASLLHLLRKGGLTTAQQAAIINGLSKSQWLSLGECSLVLRVWLLDSLSSTDMNRAVCAQWHLPTEPALRQRLLVKHHLKTLTTSIKKAGDILLPWLKRFPVDAASTLISHLIKNAPLPEALPNITKLLSAVDIDTQQQLMAQKKSSFFSKKTLSDYLKQSTENYPQLAALLRTWPSEQRARWLCAVFFDNTSGFKQLKNNCDNEKACDLIALLPEQALFSLLKEKILAQRPLSSLLSQLKITAAQPLSDSVLSLMGQLSVDKLHELLLIKYTHTHNVFSYLLTEQAIPLATIQGWLARFSDCQCQQLLPDDIDISTRFSKNPANQATLLAIAARLKGHALNDLVITFSRRGALDTLVPLLQEVGLPLAPLLSFHWDNRRLFDRLLCLPRPPLATLLGLTLSACQDKNIPWLPHLRTDNDFMPARVIESLLHRAKQNRFDNNTLLLVVEALSIYPSPQQLQALNHLYRANLRPHNDSCHQDAFLSLIERNPYAIFLLQRFLQPANQWPLMQQLRDNANGKPHAPLWQLQYQLTALRDKKESLAHSRYNGFIDITTLATICSRLQREFDAYCIAPTATNQQILQRSVNNALATPSLDKYFGVRKILKNIALCVAGIGALYLVACAINYYQSKGAHFFFNPTRHSKALLAPVNSTIATLPASEEAPPFVSALT